MNKNVIAFQKGLLVVPEFGIDNRAMAMTVQAELMQYGYMLDQEALRQLGLSDAADIKEFYQEIISYLKEITGGSRNYQPIYKGFPQQVMSMTEYELWRNQIMGYLSGGSFTAEEYPNKKGTAFEYVNYKIITAGTEEDFKKIFTTLASSGQSLTPNDLSVLKWFAKNYEELVLPDTIPFKENLSTIFSVLIQENKIPAALPKLTTTDILRIVVGLSGGDVSLPKVPKKKIKTFGWRSSYVDNTEREKFKFRNFKRKERRYILYLLESSNCDVREMKLKAQRWIRLGEKLHPGDYHAEFPKAFYAFQKLRNDKVVSWYGEVDRAFNKSFSEGLNKLSERPGEFLRRLDYLLRNARGNMQQMVLDIFSKIIENSSNKVLLEVFTHFENRRNAVTGRSIMIKGARKRTSLPDLPAFNSSLVNLIQDKIWETIKSKFKDLPELGNCWIDEKLKKIPLPTNMRSLNDSLVPIVRGERIPLFNKEAKTIRCFVHWYDKVGRIDLDLHGYLMNFNTGSKVSFGYNGIHSSSLGCYSGDVRHRRGACAEYVDIDIKKTLDSGYNYFLMVVHNFNGGKLSDIKDCVVGIMSREFPEANHTWLPSTITNSMKVAGSSRLTLVAAIDLTTGDYIHLDLDFDLFNTHPSKIKEGIIKYIEDPKLSVYDLLKWHVEARGRLVSKENADVHFLFEDFSGSYTNTLKYLGV